MTVLFGHPTGNPNSHNAALAHFEARRLETFCVPWMPGSLTIEILERIAPLRPWAKRFARRRFAPLARASKFQGRLGEMFRMVRRAIGRDDEAIAYEANDWLMYAMTRECRRNDVTAVHAYEDCSLWQFREAKRLGKACIYDMPIGYYPAWERTQADLAKELADWLPAGGLSSNRHVRPEQKRQEMELADLVMVPSSFVAKTIQTFLPNKTLALAPYGVDLEFWSMKPRNRAPEILRFIFAGQISLRKGIPGLLMAWEKAGLRSSELLLVGSWQLSESKRASLPKGVSHVPTCSPEGLKSSYDEADVFVFPSCFEGFGLVLLEAMACGLPAIASTATAGPDVLTEASGRIVPVNDVEALVEALRWFDQNRDGLPAMALAARSQAEACTWKGYRHCVQEAVAPFV